MRLGRWAAPDFEYWNKHDFFLFMFLYEKKKKMKLIIEYKE